MGISEMKKATTISYDEWMAAVQDTARARLDVVPPGWVTPETMTGPGKLSKEGVSMVHARHLLQELFKNKRAERRRFYVENEYGALRWVYHYKLIKK